MSDVGASALLVRSQDQAAVLGQGNLQILHGTHGIKSGHSRSLVISSASSVKLSVFFHRRKGLRYRPSFSGRNHIQMGNGADVRLLLAGKFCISKIILTIHGLKSHASCNLQCLVQCAPYLPAKGRACFRPGFHTGDIHHCFYVLNDVLHVCLNEIICLTQ